MSCSNIILVGNGGGLLDVKNGHKIDSYDYVVRMGNCITRGYEEYTGTRTDLYRVSWDRLLHNINKTNIYRPINLSFTFHTLLFLEHDPDIFCETTSSMFLEKNVKMYRKSFFPETSFPSYIFKKRNERITHEQCLKYFIKRHDVQAVEYMNINTRISVFLQVNTPAKQNMVLPSSGILTLAHILETRPNDNVTITGFDGFTTRYYWRDYETYFDGHSSYREKMFIKQLVKEGRIKILE
jgi:hypothetical protein